MFCVADKSPCHAELLFSVNLLSCSGLKPAQFKCELLFILICDSMQSMLFLWRTSSMHFCQKSKMCASLQICNHFRCSFSRIPLSNRESKVVYNQNKYSYFHVSPLYRENLGMSNLCLIILCYNIVGISARMAIGHEDLFQLIQDRLWTWLFV